MTPTSLAPPPGPHLALASEAVTEAVSDNPRGVDWFGVACAITDASIRDLNDNEGSPA